MNMTMFLRLGDMLPDREETEVPTEIGTWLPTDELGRSSSCVVV